MPPAQRGLRRASQINPDKGLWRCFGCNTGGSVIDLHAKLRGLSIGEAMRDSESAPEASSHGSNGFRAAPAPPGKARGHSAPKPSARGNPGAERHAEIAAYDYQDATGKVVFQVVRYEPKDFKQCRIVAGKTSLEHGRR